MLNSPTAAQKTFEVKKMADVHFFKSQQGRMNIPVGPTPAIFRVPTRTALTALCIVDELLLHASFIKPNLMINIKKASEQIVPQG